MIIHSEHHQPQPQILLNQTMHFVHIKILVRKDRDLYQLRQLSLPPGSKKISKPTPPRGYRQIELEQKISEMNQKIGEY